MTTLAFRCNRASVKGLDSGCVRKASGIVTGRKTGLECVALKRASILTGLAAAPARFVVKERASETPGRIKFEGVHHVGLLCNNLEKSLEFYCGVLGLAINEDRPDSKLPYRGAWLWIGTEMLHLMELPNPDPVDGRPEHGGRDRHVCVGVQSIEPLRARLEAASIPLTNSMSGRPAVFFRDPDGNCLEVVELEPWR